MSAEVDRGNLQLVDRLRALVARSARSHEPLPGEPTLAEQLGASRPALREALTRLEVEGLISRRRGSGTTINTWAQAITARFDQQVEFADVIAASGRTPELVTLHAAVGPLDATSARQLAVEPGVPALRTVKRWSADGRTAMVAIDDLPLRGAAADAIDPGRSLFDNTQVVAGERVEWEIARPSAVVPDDDLGQLVGEPTEALIVLDLIGVARSGRLLYRAVEYHVPGVVEFGFVRTIRH